MKKFYPYSEAEREVDKRIMAGNIERDEVGATLTPDQKARAVEFAVEAWRGNMGNGRAAELGIMHVTQD